MTGPHHIDRVRHIFDEVVGLGTMERADRLAVTCGDDQALRDEVESLLAAADARGSEVQRVLEEFQPAGIVEPEPDPPAASEEAHRGLQAAIGDRYAIQREIGRGGMATVYLAEDTKHHRQVAIKVLDPDLAATVGVGRFLREIQTAAKLTHPHILPLHDSGEADGFVYYVTPYVEGESLRVRLDRERQLPVDDALRITREIADALAYAHDRGVIHRDVKPENILLEEGHAVLTDFGVAHAMAGADQTRLTGTGVSLGTPTYMSPEQVTGERTLDGRSDQYALGCVLYEMLAGWPPFTGPHAESVVRQHLVSEPTPITQVRTTVSDGVASALVRALAKAPVDRFETVGELGRELDAQMHTLGSRSAVSGRQHRIGQGNGRRSMWIVLGGAAMALTLFWMGGVTRSPRPGTDMPRSSAGALAVSDRDLGPSIVVLPFENLGGGEESAYFAAGIQAELNRLLGLVRGLVVRDSGPALLGEGPTKTTQEVAEELQAPYVVTGSVQESDGRFRIHVQLLEATTGRYLWQQLYDRTRPEDVFEVQSEMAQTIADELGIRVAPDERGRIQLRPTQNAAAYELFMRSAEFHPDVEAENESAIALLKQAIRFDSMFALAYEEMGRQYLYARILHNRPGANDTALALAERAIELDPDLAGALVVEGMALGYYGAPSFHRALEINPSHPGALASLGGIGWWTGDHVGGALAARRGVLVAPNDGLAAYHLAQCLTLVGMYDEGTRWMNRLLEIDS